MARAEKRELSVIASLKDLISNPSKGMGRALRGFAKGAIDDFKSTAKQVLSLRTVIAGLVTGFVALKAAAGVGHLVSGIDEIAKIARATGDAVENVSELKAAFELSTIHGEKWADTLKKIQKAQSDALAGGKAQRQAFEDLGISIRDLGDLRPTEVLERVAKGLEHFSGAQEKAFALARLFPDEFQNLLPLLGQGLDKFRDAIKKARELGATVTENQAKVAEDLSSAFAAVKISAGGAARAVLEVFGPDLAKVLEQVAKQIAANKDVIIDVANAIRNVFVGAVDLGIRAIIGLVRVLERLDQMSDSLDLFGKQKLQKQVDDLEEQLFRIKLLRDKGMLSPQLQFELKDDPRMQNLEQRAQLKQELLDSLLPTLPDLERRLADLRTEAARSVSATLQQSLETFQREFQRVKEGAGKGVTVGGVTWTDVPEIPRADLPSVSVFRQAPTPDAQGTPSGKPEKQDEDPKTFIAGISLELEKARERWTAFGEAGRDAVRGIVDGGLNELSDAFGDIIMGTKSAKDAFRDLAKTMLGELARLIPRLIIMKTLQTITGTTGVGLFGLARGGIVPTIERTVPFQAFAAGGITNGPTLALLGEGEKREAVIPLPDNRHVQAYVMDRGGGGGVVQNFYVTAMDGQDVSRVLLRGRGTLRMVAMEDMSKRRAIRHGIRGAAR